MSPTPTISEQIERQWIVETLVASRNPEIGEPNPSPDGKWLAELIAYPCSPTNVVNEYISAFQILRIRTVQNAEIRIIETQLQFCGGLGAAGLSTGSWSPNSRYLYFTAAASGIPEGCGWWIPPIKRLDTTTWAVEDLGSGPLSHARDMRATWQGNALLVSSVEQGDLARFDPLRLGFTLGQIAWSPADSSLAYLLTELDCYPWGKTYLVTVDLPTSRSTLILESESPSFAWVEWKDPNKLSLRDQDDTPWTYDITTGTLTESE